MVKIIAERSRLLAPTSLAFIALTAQANSTISFAQDEDSGQLSEILVTAQRRSENLQNVPLSVTAASASELLNEGVTETASLALAVPGLSYTLGSNTGTPFIRGVGTTVLGSEASVATYVDGVYISSISALLFDLNNIDRIEVLKGPQGTLFGRNATGGVIQIITKDPAFTPHADINLDFGNYGTTSGSFYGTTGFGESIAADLAAYGKNQGDGWGTDLVTGQPTFRHNDFGARAKLLWHSGDRIRILVSVDYNRTRNEDGLGFHVVPPGLAVDGVTRFGGFYNTYDDPNDYTDVRQTGSSVTAEQESSFARLVSITSWRNVNGFALLDQDGTPLEIVRVPFQHHDNTFTEEMRLQSKEGARLPWIAGIFYLNDLAAYDPLGLMGQAVAPLDETQIRSAEKSRSYAAFGQLAPEIATDTHLTLGARYTKDDRAIRGSTTGILGPEALSLGSASQSTSWSKPTWRIALDHQFTPTVMGYIGDDRGFKSGVYNFLTYTAAPVAPEILDAYQLGIKAELPDRRLRVNTEAFYYRYKDIQVQQIVTGTTLLVNAAAAEMKGIDVDFAVLPIDAVILRGGFEIMSGHYSKFQNAPFYNPTLGPNGEPIGGDTSGEGNASGHDTVRTPKETVTASVTFRLPAPTGNLNLVVSDYYNSGFAWDPDNRLRQSSYDVVNASIDWSSPNSTWGIRLWGRNLAGAQYCSFEAAMALLDACSPAPPRTYGISLDAHL